jgi:oligoendopeptidase F
MHSYLTWQNQPWSTATTRCLWPRWPPTSTRPWCARTCSKPSTDPEFQINVIEEAMSNFHRYFFIMPTLARFELEMHQRAERGQGLAADDMNEPDGRPVRRRLRREMHVDRERVGITWATFGHLYADYYVYQYATGISGANAFSRRILSAHLGRGTRQSGGPTGR